MIFQKSALSLMMLFVFLLFIPPVSAAIPPAPPPTRDDEGTERDWDVSHPGWREKRAEAARKAEEARQLRLKRSQYAAKKKADANKRKQQAYAEAQRKKKALEAERKKEKEREVKALNMVKRFQKATAEVYMPASTNAKADEIIYEQNNLFVELLSTDAMSPEEKRNFRLILPTYKEQTINKVLESKVPLTQGGFSENYLKSSDESANTDLTAPEDKKEQTPKKPLMSKVPLIPGGLSENHLNSSDESQSPNAVSNKLGLDNESRFFAEVAEGLKGEAKTKFIDLVFGTPQNAQMAIAEEGRKGLLDFHSDLRKNTIEKLENALAAQSRLIRNMIKD